MGSRYFRIHFKWWILIAFWILGWADKDVWAQAGDRPAWGLDVSAHLSQYLGGLPFVYGASIQHGRHSLGATIATDSPNRHEVEMGIRYRIMPVLATGRIQPYMGIAFNYLRAPFFNMYYPGFRLFSAHLSFGTRFYVWRGLHAIIQTGFSKELGVSPDRVKFLFQQSWGDFNGMIGLGYTFPLQKRKDLDQSPHSPPKQDQFLHAPRHELGIGVSTRQFLIFKSTSLLKVQYAMRLSPYWDAFAGLDLVGKTGARMDSVSWEGARLGMRAFPTGRGKLQYYLEWSFGFGKRYAAEGIRLAPSLWSLSSSIGNGWRVRILPNLFAQVGFHWKAFRLIPNQIANFIPEGELDGGLLWRFGR